jgi:hypothetical protein
MAEIAPDAVQGEELYDDPSDLPVVDDRLDRRENGVVVEEPTECSATGFAKVLDLLRHLVTLVKTALLNVNLTGVSDGDMLVYNETADEWRPATPTDTDEKVAISGEDTPGYLGDKIDGTTIIANEGNKIQVGTIGDAQFDSEDPLDWSKVDTTDAEPADVGAAAASHNHSASGITSGNLALTRAPLPVQEAHTADDTLTHAADAGVLHTNAGATEEVELTVPDAAAGVGPFNFACLDTDGIKVRMPGTFKVRKGSTESSAGGYIASTTVGSTLALVPAYDAAATAWIWLALSGEGTWSAA